MSNTFAEACQLRMGMVFSFENNRINNGKRLSPNLIEVGFMNPENGVDAANDSTRVNAKYVVEHVKTSYEVPPNITSYADETFPRIYARRLNEDGTYNPDGELIVFYGKYGFDSFLSLYMTKVHKIMRRIVNFVDGPAEDCVELEREVTE